MNYVKENLILLAKGCKIIEDSNVTDLKIVYRTWAERLFTLPWTPFKKTKTIYAPIAYHMSDGTIVISPKTMQILQEALLDEEAPLV